MSKKRIIVKYLKENGIAGTPIFGLNLYQISEFQVVDFEKC